MSTLQTQQSFLIKEDIEGYFREDDQYDEDIVTGVSIVYTGALKEIAQLSLKFGQGQRGKKMIGQIQGSWIIELGKDINEFYKQFLSVK